MPISAISVTAIGLPTLAISAITGKLDAPRPAQEAVAAELPILEDEGEKRQKHAPVHDEARHAGALQPHARRAEVAEHERVIEQRVERDAEQRYHEHPRVAGYGLRGTP